MSDDEHHFIFSRLVSNNGDWYYRLHQNGLLLVLWPLIDATCMDFYLNWLDDIQIKLFDIFLMIKGIWLSIS